MEENRDLDVIESIEINSDTQTDDEALTKQNNLFDTLGADSQEELSNGKGEDEDEF